MSLPALRRATSGATLLVCAALAAACDSTLTEPRGLSPDDGFSASNGRKSISSVKVTYVSGTMDTVTWSVVVGGSAKFKATAYDGFGAVLTSTPAPKFRSSNPAALTVDSLTGAATPVAAGTATISATIQGVVGTSSTVTVKAASTTTPSPTPVVTTPTTGAITLAVQRFDGLAGTVMVSNGIPLTKGLVTSANLSQVHLLVNGVEQKVYVKPLFGHYADGSLRTILVQFDYDIPSAAPIAGSLVVDGTARTLGDLAARPAQQVPAAAALPTDPNYLVATRWTGATYTANTPVSNSLLTQYEGDYVRLEAADWTTCGTKWDCGRTAGYDKAFIAYQEWQRTGNATYWYHATAEAADYLRNYIIPNQSPTPWWSQSEGVALHYWATGDEMSRYQLRKIAETMAWQVRAGTTYSITGTYGDDRMRAKALFAALDAAMLEISTQPADAANYYSLNGGTAYYAQFLTPSTLGTWIPGILATQQTTTGHVGMFGGSQYGGGQSNYMVGMLLSGLIRYYEEITPDSRIPAAVKKCIDDMWANEWNASGQGFNYNSLRGTLADGTPATVNPLPGLNGLIATSFAWYARVSGDATYIQRVDTQLQGLATPTSRNWWASSGKAFDEAFYRIFNTFAYRAGLK